MLDPHVVLFAGVAELVAVVGAMAIFVHLGRGSERKSLLNAILFAFSVLLGVWLVDKTAAYQLMLLSTTESATLFALVKDCLLLVFGFYFGSARPAAEHNP